MLEFRQTEVRAEGRILTGLAVPFDVETQIGAGLERFERGAALPSGDALLNVHHRADRPLAREPQTLTFESRDDGLHFTAELPETREADDALANVRAGILTGASIEFRAMKETMTGGVRVIKSAAVSGLALVTRAAYSTTRLEARGAMLAAALAGAASGPEIDAAAQAAGILPEQLRRALSAFGQAFPEPSRAEPDNWADWVL